jgi:hypothetical protein
MNSDEPAFELPPLPKVSKAPEKAKPVKASKADEVELTGFWKLKKKDLKSQGFWGWRMDRTTLEPKPVKSKHLHLLHVTDTYIFLRAKRVNGSWLKKEIHMWVGTKTTPKEMGAAAVHTLKLDKVFASGAADHHRQAQGDETSDFLSSFKHGLQYLVDDAATLVETSSTSSNSLVVGQEEVRTRLLQIRGKPPGVRCQEIECSWRSLHGKGFFILEGLPGMLIVWQGPQLPKAKMIAGNMLVEAIRVQEYHGAVEVVNMTAGDCDEEQERLFWEAVGVDPDTASQNEPMLFQRPGPTDAEEDVEDTARIRAFWIRPKLIGSGGKPLKLKKNEGPPLTVVEFEKEATFSKGNAPHLQKGLLQPERVLLIDVVGTVFVWIGSKADARSRQCAMLIAQHYAYVVSKKSAWVRLMRVVHNAEQPRFRKCFFSWDKTKRMSNLGETTRSGWGGAGSKSSSKSTNAEATGAVEEQQALEDAQIDVQALVRNRIEHDRDADDEDEDEDEDDENDLCMTHQAVKKGKAQRDEEMYKLRVWMLLPAASERLATAAAGADIAKKVAAASFGGDSTHKETLIKKIPQLSEDDGDVRAMQCKHVMIAVPDEEIGVFYSEAEYLVEAYALHAVEHEDNDPVLDPSDAAATATAKAVPLCAAGHEMKMVKPSRTRTKEGGVKTNVKCQGCGKGLYSSDVRYECKKCGDGVATSCAECTSRYLEEASNANAQSLESGQGRKMTAYQVQ